MILKLLRPVLIHCIILSLFSVTAFADYFSYTNSDGTVVMVDDESKIPTKYRKKTRSTKAGEAKSKFTAVRVRKNQVFVPVQLTYRGNTVEAWLLLDTGASTTLISSSLANRLGIDQSSTQSSMARVADGAVVRVSQTRLDYMVVGPKQQNNPEIAIISATVGDGLLGMSFLSDFSYRLDTNTHVIEWL
jgi:clan AA aspartic protease (TIGR02281 family)